jgi:hypothetical protein
MTDATIGIIHICERSIHGFESKTAGTRPDGILGMLGAHVFRIEKGMFLVSHSSTRIALHDLVAYCAFEAIKFIVALSMKRVFPSIFSFFRTRETFIGANVPMTTHAFEAFSVVGITKSRKWHQDHLIANCTSGDQASQAASLTRIIFWTSYVSPCACACAWGGGVELFLFLLLH